ncbi:hypothetical protein FIM12_05410 [SAR202 cluster bacterium AD-804-J14_MRT_500m]|nr:hypothetical protein [SAR202 cluster bacterium AD-804-J14_MRT_500m]
MAIRIMGRTSTDLCFLTIRQAGELMRNIDLSPVELTEAFLHRIDQIDNKLHSYVTILADSALAEARTAETEMLKGAYRGPLHGIPLAHKDLYDTAGVSTTGQSKVMENRVPSMDSTVISRLKGAGSVLLGKVAMYEFALGGPETSLFEQAVNPWNLECLAGGSSSGSGAAVAAGLCMGSMGSDTGGSIRWPAAVCGTVGLKATYGRTSRYGVLPLSWSLDHCGPLTRTVEDAAYILQAIAGYDVNDPTSSRAPVPDYSAALRDDVKGLTIGVPTDYCFNPASGVDPEVITAVKKALSTLEELGASVRTVEIPCLEYAGTADVVIMIAEAYAYHRDNLRSQLDNYGQPLRYWFTLGGLLSGNDVIQAQRVRSQIKKEFCELLQQVDLLVMPTVAGPAPKTKGFDIFTFLEWPNFMAPFNISGMPAMSIPCGFHSTGLPLGLQIAGKPFDELTVLRAGYAYERATKWYDHRPLI